MSLGFVGRAASYQEASEERFEPECLQRSSLASNVVLGEWVMVIAMSELWWVSCGDYSDDYDCDGDALCGLWLLFGHDRVEDDYINISYRF